MEGQTPQVEISIANSAPKRDASPDDRSVKKQCLSSDEHMQLGNISCLNVFDASYGYDFSQDSVRDDVLKVIAESKPHLIIAGVMCPRGPGTQGWKESLRHNKFVTELYR